MRVAGARADHQALVPQDETAQRLFVERLDLVFPSRLLLIDPDITAPPANSKESVYAAGSRQGAYTAARSPNPARWYCLTAAFMVESPSVACLVRLPITSLPRESTNSS